MGTGFAKKKKETKLFQKQLAEMQSSFEKKEATGSAGNGLVTVTLSGEGVLKTIRIQPECVDREDVEGLQLLIKTAHETARQQLQEQLPTLPSGIG